MKKLITLLALVLALLMVASFCGCGKKSDSSSSEADSDSSSSAADPAPASSQDTPDATQAPSIADASVAGVYELFGFSTEEGGDMIIDSTGVATATYTLNDNGTGLAVEDDESIDITWEVNGDTITLAEPSGASVSGTVKDGVLIIEIDDGKMYLAKAGADLSAYELVSVSDLVEDSAE